MIIGLSGKIGSGKDTVAKIIQYLTLSDTKAGIAFSETKEIDIIKFLNKFDGNRYSDFQVKKFAGKLKDIICSLIGCTREQLESEEFKNSFLGEEWNYWEDKTEYGQRWIYDGNRKDIKEYKDLITHNRMTVRKLLQLLGTEALREVIHPNVHINALFADYKAIKGYQTTDTRIGMLGTDATISIPHLDVDKRVFPNWLISDLRFENEAQSIKDRNGLLIRINRDNGTRAIDTNPHPSETALDGYKHWDYIIDNNGTIEELIEKVRQILIEEKII